jgi:hypothetical protein
MSDKQIPPDEGVRSLRVVAASTNSSQVDVVDVMPEYESILKGQVASPVRSLDNPEFGEIFRKAGSGTIQDADAFFNSFKYVQDLWEGHHSHALESGMSLLNQCVKTDAALYEQIHKGTVFYWLGMAAFLVHDYETAVYFFDAAVSEDIRAGRDPIHDPSPSFRFILIEGDRQDQAAEALVMETQNRVEDCIDDYNALSGHCSVSRNLDLNDVREKFLKVALSSGREAWRSLATTFISFFLEWDYRSRLIGIRVGVGTSEPFYLHLFKGCVLFESLLKANPKNRPPGQMLGQVLNHLSSDLGIPPNLGIGGATFPSVVYDISSADDEIKTAVKFTGRIRNTVGHDLGWNTELDRSQYDKLASMIASACLHCIACLYR